MQKKDKDSTNENPEIEDSLAIHAKYASASKPFWSLLENDKVVSFNALPCIFRDFVLANIAVFLGNIEDEDNDDSTVPTALLDSGLTTLTTPDLDENFAFMATQFASEMLSFFVVDSRCSQHASYKRENFVSL